MPHQSVNEKIGCKHAEEIFEIQVLHEICKKRHERMHGFVHYSVIQSHHKLSEKLEIHILANFTRRRICLQSPQCFGGMEISPSR